MPVLPISRRADRFSGRDNALFYSALFLFCFAFLSAFFPSRNFPRLFYFAALFFGSRSLFVGRATSTRIRPSFARLPRIYNRGLHRASKRTRIACHCGHMYPHVVTRCLAITRNGQSPIALILLARRVAFFGTPKFFESSWKSNVSLANLWERGSSLLRFEALHASAGVKSSGSSVHHIRLRE